LDAAERWAAQLEKWAIPDEVLDNAEDSPWVLPRSVFRRRADQQIAHPLGATFQDASAALRTPGNVLDVGAAAGATSLPLAQRCPVTHITAIDTDQSLLDGFAERADPLGVPFRLVRGAWPALAGEAGPADVVVCGNVVYNVPHVVEFVHALTTHARRSVVVETAARHPLTELTELWERFHGLSRPEGPTADDFLAVLNEIGLAPRVTRWSRPPEHEHATFADLVDVTRRRLCLPRSAGPQVDRALRDLGVDPRVPPDLGSSGRDLVTITWDGSGR
jgi:2-polyprenyl-3-methyl-5-hydroxy-6-metoxy-1,4-benzoquinol methylase